MLNGKSRERRRRDLYREKDYLIVWFREQTEAHVGTYTHSLTHNVFVSQMLLLQPLLRPHELSNAHRYITEKLIPNTR